MSPYKTRLKKLKPSFSMNANANVKLAIKAQLFNSEEAVPKDRHIIGIG